MFLAPVSTGAQFAPGTDPFTLSISPQYPAPYGRVIITPVSGQVDITSGVMTATVGGKEVYRGNAATIEVTLGAPGSTSAIVVRLVSDGRAYTQNLTLTPQDVVLVPEPLASTPMLYAGKPLVPLDGSVRIVAMADLRTGAGKRLDPTTLAYSWVVDGVQIGNASGIGKRALIVESPLPYRSRTVEVRAASPDGKLAGAASLDLVAAEPTLRIYERDPLLGIRFGRALNSTYALRGSESTLYAAAYSFPSALGTPILEWFVAGVSAQKGSFITLRPTGAGAGSASLSVTGSTGGVAGASSNLSVTFGSGSGSSFFGL